MLAIDFDKRKVSPLNIDFIAANRLRVSQSIVSTRHSLAEGRNADGNHERFRKRLAGDRDQRVVLGATQGVTASFTR